jgi:hypothetical protein
MFVDTLVLANKSAPILYQKEQKYSISDNKRPLIWKAIST